MPNNDSEQFTDPEELIGTAVRRLREQFGYSQADFAEMVREKGGFPWSQSTVWSIETGKRPLKLSEAILVAEILEVSLGDLLYPANPVLAAQMQAFKATRYAQSQIDRHARALRESQIAVEFWEAVGRVMSGEHVNLPYLIDDIHNAIERAAYEPETILRYIGASEAVENYREQHGDERVRVFVGELLGQLRHLGLKDLVRDDE